MSAGPHPRLATYLEAWRDTADRLVALADELADDEWDRPTDLPGWSVRDVYAHLAAIEAELAGLVAPLDGSPADLGKRRNDVDPAWTQAGVDARADRTPAELVAELADSVAERSAQLRADPPTDPAAPADRVPAALSWDWETLLRHRVVDLWMHEQDVRRAVDRPGGLASPGAAVTLRTYAAALPYVLAKRAAAPSGTTVVWEVADAFTAAAGVGENGRGATLTVEPADPAVRLRMSAGTFVVLCGGRRDPASCDVDVIGDRELGAALLTAMRVTP